MIKFERMMKQIKNKFNKIILVLFSLLIVSMSVVPTVLAVEGTWYQQSYQEWLTKVVDKDNPTEIFGERYTYAQVQWIIFSLFTFISTGGDKELGGAVSCLMTKEAAECSDSLKVINDSFKQVNENTSYIPQDKSIAGFFKSKSISGIGYALNSVEKFSVVPVAQAQIKGFGYSANNVIMNLWKGVRDISYLFLTIAVVVLAFMIMFKVKINPQTVISIQSALPRVVVAIILITFSYAIAGFLIDIMYIVLGIISAFLIRTNISSDKWVDLFYFITSGANVIWLFLNYFVVFILAIFINQFFTILGIGAAAFALQIALILLILLLIIGVIIVFVQIFKTVVLLLKTFIQITLSIIVAPLQILLGTINPQLGFSSWLRSMAANLAVYPVVTLLFILAFYFLRQSLTGILGFIDLGFLVPFHLNSSLDFSQGTWDPPLTFGTGENGYKFLLIVSSVGIVSMIPKTAELIKALIEGKPFDMRSALAEVTSPIRSITSSTPYRTISESYSSTRFADTMQNIAQNMQAGPLRNIGNIPVGRGEQGVGTRTLADFIEQIAAGMRHGRG